VRALLLVAAVTQVVSSATHRPEFWRYAWNDWYDQRRIALMGHNTVRLDMVEPAQLDPLVDRLLHLSAAPAFVLDRDFEIAEFRRRYAARRGAAAGVVELAFDRTVCIDLANGVRDGRGVDGQLLTGVPSTSRPRLC
jgi:hypothetical protein